MNANQAVRHGDVAAFALFGVAKERVGHPDAIDQRIVQCDLRRLHCPIGARIVQSWIVPGLTKDQIRVVILHLEHERIAGSLAIRRPTMFTSLIAEIVLM